MTDNQKFIKAWENGESLTEVAEELGYTTKSVKSMASRLRVEGLQLKQFPRGFAVSGKAVEAGRKSRPGKRIKIND